MFSVQPLSWSTFFGANLGSHTNSPCAEGGKHYPPVIKHGNGKSSRNGGFNGKSLTNGPFSFAMFDYRRVLENSFCPLILFGACCLYLSREKWALTTHQIPMQRVRTLTSQSEEEHLENMLSEEQQEIQSVHVLNPVYHVDPFWCTLSP